MKYRELQDLMSLCKMAGFKDFGEVCAYMEKEHINIQQLYHELDGLLYPEFISLGI